MAKPKRDPQREDRIHNEVIVDLSSPNPGDKVMKKPKKDPIREGRIHNDAIADANGPEELVMGWHCYLDDKIRFPFQARCIARRIVSPLREGDTIEVHRMAPEDACSRDNVQVVSMSEIPLHAWHPPFVKR